MAKPYQELLYPNESNPTSSSNSSGILSWLVRPIQDRMFLPLAGLWILGLDWMLFPPEATTLGMSTPLTSLLGFVLGTMGVYQMQRRFAQDDKPRATFKALVAGVIVGLPFSMAGTVVGAWILATSGLIHLRDRLFCR